MITQGLENNHSVQHTMNILRLTGDQLRLFAVVLLLIKIIKTRSCTGISGKTQILLALQCTTRYLDLFTYFVSTYNTSMKILFSLISYFTLILIYIVYKKTFEREHDTCRIEYILTPVMMLALLVNHEFSAIEILWTFSTYLESVSLIPQLMFIIKKGEFDGALLVYLFCMVSYRSIFYLSNWIYRYYYEGYFDIICIIAALVEGIVFIYFFIRCVYSIKRKETYQKNLKLILNSPENFIINDKILKEGKNLETSSKKNEKVPLNFDNLNINELPAVHNFKIEK
ncbi:ER lumen protein-retaining receptor 2-like isoform X2 [Leptopilina boulardi]|uniref:ER lumen protein-retaining receptor 2-like isoform X2 n=1 Tax=Leptopilina boulardi TaxID=63433 RepID=UPI0021F5ACB1|nr:ER lumen protein-retaining receptor 2-like isoform X2 [Leptopilina boulardi]